MIIECSGEGRSQHSDTKTLIQPGESRCSLITMRKEKNQDASQIGEDHEINLREQSLPPFAI